MINSSKLIVYEKDIKQLIKSLKNKEIDFFGVPEEYRVHPIIAKTERELGIRKSDKRGYDVIHNRFFVEEIILSKDSFNDLKEDCRRSYFANFKAYYEFLDGDIYENACYYQYSFSQKEIDFYGIDMSKINITAFIDYNINDFSVEMSKDELAQYNEIEKDKLLRMKWIDKFNSCNNYKEFERVIQNFIKSKFSVHDLEFFLFNFIFTNKEKAFDIIMQFINCGTYRTVNKFEYALCTIYNPQKVLAAYNYTGSAASTNKRYKKELKEFINKLGRKEVHFSYHIYFDERTHFFCKSAISNNLRRNFRISQYFESFEELAKYLKNDLSNCDLSKAILPDIDFSVYKTDEHTKLPIQNQSNLAYSIYKGYNRHYDVFVVKQIWLNTNGKIIKEHKEAFKYFFDFVFFLQNDLSNANLLFCDGINNLHEFSSFKLANVRLRSNIFDRLGETYQLSTINTADAQAFPAVIKNEEETALILASKREDYDSAGSNQKVYYVSDLHLLHRIKNFYCKSKDDVLYTIQKIIDNLLYEMERREKSIFLIGGDTASNFDLFCLFLQLLRHSIDEKNLDVQVIFLLGNHELWGFPGYSFKRIVQQYETEITKYKMYLLQNDIIYKDDDNKIQKITSEELLSISKESLRLQLRCARIILFGGLGFSGYNEKFNANNKVYKDTISRNQEINESKTFENLYKIVCNALSDRNVIIFTHTPKADWCADANWQSGFVYVSGHTHRNCFYDDGEYRLYADNQIGYKNINPYSKYFYLEDEYDYFSEYSDGIYKITKEQYINFYRGKNIPITYTREVIALYMLKKSGYYCFIHQSVKNQLSILNGGALKKLDAKDINYYYERMDTTISYIKNPLDKFLSLQEQIANEIKVIGGSGNIHGAIVDIDFYNHIYVNPHDLTITGYWASDIIYKKVFPSVPNLLEVNCPNLYENYTRLINSKTQKSLIIRRNQKQELDGIPKVYLDTDIYKASREIKKMQKLYSNILSAWHEPTQKMLD